MTINDNAIKTKQYLFKLFIARSFASLTLLLIFSWFEIYTQKQSFTFITLLVFLWVSLSFTQLLMLRYPKYYDFHVLYQLSCDTVFIAFIIYGSTGLTSPFVFLLGLVIVVAGAQAHTLLTLIITIIATSSYLIAIYATSSPIETESTLKILLQISLFFLTGGIMAFIARRHAMLQDKESQTSSEHKQLQEIHGQVLQSMHEGIITLSKKFHILAFNPAAAKILHLSSQLIGSEIKTFITVPEALYEFTRNGTKDIFQHEVSKDNLDLLLTFTRLHNDSKASWLLTIVDITESRKLERQLGEKNKLASIGQMAALLAHEIRNPMQTISQAVELMGLKLPDKKLEHIITDEISRLNRLLSDLLDYAHPLQPQPKNISTKQLIHASVEHIDLTNTHAIVINTTDTTILLDPDHFRLMLDNLIRNAIRVSPQRESIHLNFSLKQASWQLTVRDHGSGIDPAIKNTLFQPFQTSHKTGIGLGLATVWQVCQTNHWKISIDDSIEDGACFVIQGSLVNESQVTEVAHG